jgi:hypothetical protein
VLIGCGRERVSLLLTYPSIRIIYVSLSAVASEGCAAN